MKVTMGEKEKIMNCKKSIFYPYPPLTLYVLLTFVITLVLTSTRIQNLFVFFLWWIWLPFVIVIYNISISFFCCYCCCCCCGCLNSKGLLPITKEDFLHLRVRKEKLVQMMDILCLFLFASMALLLK